MIFAQRSAASLATPVLAVLTAALLVAACTEDGPGGLPGSFDLAVVLDGIGSGTVTSDPAGIDCGPATTSCTATFDEGAAVTLTATPEGDHAFLSWSGGVTGTTPAVTVDIGGDLNVTATFDDPDLAIQEIGGDGGTIASRDGQVTLEIPAGALDATREITIERIDPAGLGAEWDTLRVDLDGAYEMGPDGTQFSAPVEVRLSATPVTPGGTTLTVSPPDLLTNGTVFLDSMDAAYDPDSGMLDVSAWTDHFSQLVVRERSMTFTWHLPPAEVPLGSTFEIGGTYSAPYGLSRLTVEEGTDWKDYFPIQSVTGPIDHEWDLAPYDWPAVFRCTGIGPAEVLIRYGVIRQTSRTVAYFSNRVSVNCVGHALTVEVIGPGTVTSDPEGFLCGSSGTHCTEAYAPDATVTLMGTPDPGAEYVGCAELTEFDPEDATDCIITLDGDERVEVEFRVLPEEELTATISGPAGTVVDATGALTCEHPGGEPATTCVAQVAGDITLTATTADGSRVTDFSGDGTTDADGNRVVKMDGPKNVGVTIPTVPQLAAFITLQSVYYLEALTLMPWVFPFLLTDGSAPALAADASDAVGPACPNLLGAADGGAYVFDGCTGEIVQEYPFAGDRFYDAIALVPPAGYDGVHQVLATGQNWVHCYIQDDGTTGAGCLGSSGPDITDAQYIDPDDPTAGALFVQGGGWGVIRFIVFDPAQGHFDSHPDRFGAQQGFITSAVAGIPSEDPTLPPNESLLVGWKWNEEFTAKIGVLNHAEMYPAGGGDEVATLVGELPGNDPRRLRCDLDSGICAVSDFTSDHVTIILWDGTGLPTLAGTTAPGEIGDGPVGVDVLGNRIVTAGFNADDFTIIEVDAAGAIVATTTTALPAGCTQPGHAMFLEDGANTVLVSCWGSGGFARIPNAF